MRVGRRTTSSNRALARTSNRASRSALSRLKRSVCAASAAAVVAVAVIGQAAADPRSSAATPAALQSAGKSFFVTVGGPNQPSVRLFGRAFGRRSNRPIVLLHGLGASTYSWRRVVPHLSRHHHVVALDLRGHGKSDKPFDLNYAQAAQAELVRDAIRKLGLRNVTLVGHSYGGAVALVAALQANANRERRIRRLVLLNAPVLPQKLSMGVRFLQQPVLPYVALTVLPPEVPVSLALFAEAVGMPHITQRDIELYAQPYFDPGSRHALIETARQIIPVNAAHLIAHYPTVRQRTLVVWCRDDQVVPLATGKAIVRKLPRARLRVLEGCDHASPEQKPGTVAKLIARHARR